MSTDGRPKNGGKDEGTPGEPEKSKGLLRRTFLQAGSGSLAAITLADLLGCEPAATGTGLDHEARLAAIQEGATSFDVTVYRREDMVALTFTFYNMALDSTGTVIQRVFNRNGALAAFVVVRHEPQHLLERAFIEDSAPFSDPPPAKGPVATWASARSRVAYYVPDDVNSIPFTTEDLLAAAGSYQLSVGLNAAPPPPPITRRIGPGGLALGPLLGAIELSTTDLTRNLAETNANSATSATGSAAVAANALALTQTIRATRGLRALTLASGTDVGFSRAATLPPLEILPTTPKRANALETSLEIPFRVEMSPNSSGQFAHALDPVTSPENRTELWHSRLGTRGSHGQAYEGASYLRTLRALWTRDQQMDPADPEKYKAPPYEHPFGPAPLRPMDRVRIVHQSSNWELKDIKGKAIVPAPVDVNRLMLTSLGGWMDVRGNWGDNPALNLALWENRTTMGRDHFVKIVETGYLYPFGHRAVLVTITERKFKSPQHPHEAFLRKRTFLVIKEPTVDYSSGRAFAGVASMLRQMPFQSVTIKTLMTPPLDGSPPPKDPLPPPIPTPPSPFAKKLIRVGGVPFRFHCEALDPEGRLVKFTAPGIWIEGNANSPVDPAVFAIVQNLYGIKNVFPETAYTAAQTKCDLAGQRVAYATSNKTDDTTFETKSITFTAEILSGAQANSTGYEARFVPEIAQAELSVQAVRHLADAKATPAFSYHKNFIDHGFDGAVANKLGTGNAGEMLFGLAEGASPIGVSFSKSSDKSGGFLSPNMSVSGLSRKIGPVGGDPSDLAGVAGGHFDAKKFFAGLDAKLFGVIDLFSIIQDVVGDLESAAPKFITQALDAVEGFIEDAKAISDDVEAALASATTLVDAVLKVTNDITALLPDPTAQPKIDTLIADLSTLKTALGGLKTAPWPTDMNKGLIKDILRRADQIKGVIDLLDPNNPTGPMGLFLNAADMAKEMRVKLEWRPPIQAFSLSGDTVNDPLFSPTRDLGGSPPVIKQGGLVLSAEVRAKAAAGKPAGVDLIASLENFTVYLIGKENAFLTIPFEHIQFSILAGKKPDVDVKFGDFVFGGVLEFVKTLSELIPGNGFSDPPSVDVDETGITAQFSVALPDITVGILAITNISLGAGFKIPFIGDPLSVNFNFCTRENPFILTVMMIGGGGFFGITLDPKGVKLLEAQFEAGAEIALDFGVASGSVSVMVGIYFKMEGDNCTLTAFFKIHGEVEVLGGIISASLTLELDLTYESATKKLTGTASMEIEVHVIFFSIGVTVTCTKTLAGGNGDPSFVDAMRPAVLGEAAPYAPWDEYVAAFAA